jgi:DNA-binding NarL/FixJ family response regulator
MPPRILIADDNPVVRTTLRHLLESLQACDIIEAQDGQEAVARALEIPPVLAILDLAMPGVDGLNAARQISQALPTLPIVMYTMHFSPHLEVEAMKYGVRKLVSKTQSSVLVSTVQELLAAQASAPQPSPNALPPVALEGVPAVELAAPPPADTSAAPAPETLEPNPPEDPPPDPTAT